MSRSRESVKNLKCTDSYEFLGDAVLKDPQSLDTFPPRNNKGQRSLGSDSYGRIEQVY